MPRLSNITLAFESCIYFANRAFIVLCFSKIVTDYFDCLCDLFMIGDSYKLFQVLVASKSKDSASESSTTYSSESCICTCLGNFLLLSPSILVFRIEFFQLNESRYFILSPSSLASLSQIRYLFCSIFFSSFIFFWFYIASIRSSYRALYFACCYQSLYFIVGSTLFFMPLQCPLSSPFRSVLMYYRFSLVIISKILFQLIFIAV